ncbi:MAG TPA: histidinol-phosphate transaminase [Gammaproteobacteria bacterium]|nr:histidinol-phosphate transaminase [Gammaproteobacteria bacterium]
MTSILDLARQELRTLRPYTPGAYEPGCIRLNANESPWRTPGDTSERGLNVYPPPRPAALTEKLSAYYGIEQRQILVTRGSSEAIDVLIRGFCTAGRDGILICPPTFDMYRLYASIQGADVRRVPLIRDRSFALDTAKVLGAVDGTTKLIFICSPNNPTGQSVAREDVETICREVAGRALVVIDEAYHEFADAQNFLDLRNRYEHVVLLRTLSKFVSLAGVRCGLLIAAPELVEFSQNVLPPYTFPTPSIELVLQAMSTDSLRISRERVALLKRERRRLAEALLDVPQILKVYPSDANFILVKTANGQRFREAARRAGVLVRTFDDPLLTNCVRITVGRPEDNDRLLQAVSGTARIADA